MQIHRSDLAHCAQLDGAVVVIDVLRAFTTAAYAFAHGARSIVAIDSIEALPALRRRYPDALAVGSKAGGAPVAGFDLGNSPSQLIRLDVAGRTLIMYTVGGVRGIAACARATTILAAALVNAGATARHLLALAPPTVTLVVTGTWTDRDGDEDIACADRIEAILRGKAPPANAHALRVRRSDFGRRFASGKDPNLPPADLDCCAAADLFDFAMPIERTGDRLTITPLPIAQSVR
ncbi:MAG: 2-phosphosulfolactate phosphatase [Gemmatimonadota bacterium]